MLKAGSTPSGQLRGSSEGLREEWRELAERCAAPPFMHPGWFELFERSFRLPESTILTARRQGRLAGVLPVTVVHGVARSPTNWHTPLFGAITEDEDAALLLAGHLVRRVPRRVDLSMLDSGDLLLPALRQAARAARMTTIDRVVASQPYVDLSVGADAYAASLGRKHRKEIGRLRRRLEERGEVTFTVHDGSERLDALLDEGFAIEATGWKADNGTAIVSSEQTRSFYTEAARWAAASGWLRLMFLRLDGRAIAFDMCIEAAGADYVLKGGFDPEFRRYGPGVTLTWEALQRAFALGLSTYDFLGTADPYKLAWTPETADRRRFQAFGRGPAGRLEDLAWRHGRPLAKRAIAGASALRTRGRRLGRAPEPGV